MIQNIIVGVILVVVFSYVLYKIYKAIKTPEECKGCSSDCGGCALKDIIDKKQSL